MILGGSCTDSFGGSTMKRTTVIFLALFSIHSIVLAIPAEINYQGTLKDKNGNPVNSSKTPLTIKYTLTDQSGNNPYSDTIETTPTIINGLFSAKLDFNLKTGYSW